MDIVTVAATAMSLVINGLPITAYYLKGAHDPCEMASATAKEWRRQGNAVVESKVGDWCTVGMVSKGEWIAQQWRAIGTPNTYTRSGQSESHRSEGWRTHIPLHGFSNRSLSRSGVWNLDLIDRSIGTRIQFRRSQAASVPNGQLSPASPVIFKSFGKGGLWVDGLDPSGGHYSIAIQRGALK
jgi:hypothetical protein